MIELPESVTLSKQFADSFLGKKVKEVEAEQTAHGFGWYSFEPEAYPALLNNKELVQAHALGGQVELVLGDMHLVFNDGITPRFLAPDDTPPNRHQLLLRFEDGSGFVCTVRMYGGMMIYPLGKSNNEYYLASRNKPMPLTQAFTSKYFMQIIDKAGATLSAKALLATEQRIPGLGNGVLQDILFNAHIHPQKKLRDLCSDEIKTLFSSIKATLEDMTALGGRDTEKDLYGNPGGYQTVLSSKTKKDPCPRCGTSIIKKAYLGGSVYFCPLCQPL